MNLNKINHNNQLDKANNQYKKIFMKMKMKNKN